MGVIIFIIVIFVGMGIQMLYQYLFTDEFRDTLLLDSESMYDSLINTNVESVAGNKIIQVNNDQLLILLYTYPQMSNTDVLHYFARQMKSGKIKYIGGFSYSLLVDKLSFDKEGGYREPLKRINDSVNAFISSITEKDNVNKYPSYARTVYCNTYMKFSRKVFYELRHDHNCNSKLKKYPKAHNFLITLKKEPSDTDILKLVDLIRLGK